MIKREKDMFLGGHDLEPLYTMHKFPVYCGVTEEPVHTDMFADMKWMISRASGMIQLGELLPLEVLYSVSHNESVGKKWQMHHEAFARFLNQYAGKQGILEIGGGNGILNSIYQRLYGKGGGIPWTIVEPSYVVKDTGCSAGYIRQFWDEHLDLEGVAYDTLVHSHLMEHQYDLRQFMMLNARALMPGQKMIFTLPDLKFWLKRKYSNALFFEHTYLISDDYIKEILAEYGFFILEKKSFGDGHSLFYAAEKTGTDSSVHTKKPDYAKLYQSNRSDFLEFVSYFEEKVNTYQRAVDQAGGNVYLFGAHIFSQMLLNFGLRTENIKNILDNDPRKQGKRLYGTDLSVISPKELAGEERPVVILNAGAYTEEIRQDLLQNVNADTVIVE